MVKNTPFLLRRIPVFFAAVLLTATPLGRAASLPTVEAEMAASAVALLESLSPEAGLRIRAAFDSERKDWHYTPVNRSGVALSELTPPQRERVFSLLSKGLSEHGLKQVEDIRSLEQILQVLEGPDRRFPRDPSDYHVWIFGQPGGDVWGWRFEGHHISVNATVVPGVGVSMTPSFFGANPAEVLKGERMGFRAMAAEEDLAFALVESLGEAQRKQAIFQTDAPREIFTNAQREISPLPIEGISYQNLDAKQQVALRALIDAYLLRNRPEIRDDALDKIAAAGWSEVHFAWAGPISRSEGNYYLVQGPGFLIEYDNTQTGNNHIHSVWREFDGDFGEDLIRNHRHEHSH